MDNSDFAESRSFAPEYTTKPALVVETCNLPRTVSRLRDYFAASGDFFDRGELVKIIRSPNGGPPQILRQTANNVVWEAHQICHPVQIKDGIRVSVTLPDRAAAIYLDLQGQWNVPPLAGLTSSPLLSDDGSIRTAEGYDKVTGLWIFDPPYISVPDHPAKAEAEISLRVLRQAFFTFPFADGIRNTDPTTGISEVDLSCPPGLDESSFLAALLTAVCRPSLWLAPGWLVKASTLSGSGSGKGKLVRAVCSVAFNQHPRAFTSGQDRQELDKRIAAELMEANSALFLDNVNRTILQSETLTSAMTERPARVRVLGRSKMVDVNSAAFIAVTGNGVTVSEDLARRFLVTVIDAGCEEPEARPFPPGFLEQIKRRRVDLLTAALTIWRWGRQNEATLSRGRPLGSFEDWAAWVRDPLLTLGCCDPVTRISQVKAQDPQRRQVVELFTVWLANHANKSVKISELHQEVKAVADPQLRGRQYLESKIHSLVGTRAVGLVLTRQEAVGLWGAATFALVDANASEIIGQEGSKHTQTAVPPESPMPPMPPMPPMTSIVPDAGRARNPGVGTSAIERHRSEDRDHRGHRDHRDHRDHPERDTDTAAPSHSMVIDVPLPAGERKII